jgi:hypothetical protein
MRTENTGQGRLPLNEPEPPRRPAWTHCDGCGASLRKRPLGPMLTDDAWQQIGDPDELLCGPCVFKRARERGIKLTLASLQPCPLNLFDRPNSWFDLLQAGESREPADLGDEWRRAAELVPRPTPRRPRGWRHHV